MSKPTKKRTVYNADILKKLVGRYGFTEDYIRKALRGDRDGEMPDILKKEYKALDNVSKSAIQEKANSLKP
jgi:predicted ATP-dependent Lon-type protease